MFSIILMLVLGLTLPWDTEQHGRLMDPPNRSSLWRFGYDAPINYNDNELYCGGYTV